MLVRDDRSYPRGVTHDFRIAIDGSASNVSCHHRLTRLHEVPASFASTEHVLAYEHFCNLTEGLFLLGRQPQLIRGTSSHKAAQRIFRRVISYTVVPSHESHSHAHYFRTELQLEPKSEVSELPQ